MSHRLFFRRLPLFALTAFLVSGCGEGGVLEADQGLGFENG